MLGDTDAEEVVEGCSSLYPWGNGGGDLDGGDLEYSRGDNS